MSVDANKWIQKLDLKPHPEGGYFKEVYRSEEVLPKPFLPKRFEGNRSIATSIYFLLNNKDVSKVHRIKSDEIWHHYEGSAVQILMIDTDGKLTSAALGKNIDEGESPQVTVPREVWFAAGLKDTDSFALVGCAVAPGFDFEDFEMADSKNLPPELQTNIQLIKDFL